jgi:uncharacterized membrane protein SpoIIM required for sporulation
MKESVFVKENAEKWKRFESIIKDRSHAGADEIAENYIKVTDDLSYAATFYADSKSTAYLNQLSRSFHNGIYKNKLEKYSRFITFFTTEIPLAVYQSHRQMLYAFLFFMGAVLVGVVSTANDDSFARAILSDEYVNVTLANIAKGDPMAIYKGSSPGAMFLGISTNNIYVAFLAFISGIFFSVGTVIMLLRNGVMVGAFVTFFANRGFGQVAMLSIFLHGALELSAIVIAGGAGMLLGNSILFPGTYSRGDALAMAGKQGIKILVGLIPVFITAAIFESYVTRHYQQLPLTASLAVIAGSFMFIIWYFIIFPLQQNTKANGKN